MRFTDFNIANENISFTEHVNYVIYQVIHYKVLVIDILKRCLEFILYHRYHYYHFCIVGGGPLCSGGGHTHGVGDHQFMPLSSATPQPKPNIHIALPKTAVFILAHSPHLPGHYTEHRCRELCIVFKYIDLGYCTLFDYDTS